MTTTDTNTAGDDAQPAGLDYVSDRKFVDFPISRELLQGILDHGYLTATPIQAATIEPALAGRDLLARAKTGTGKTAAFAIPTIELIDPALDKPQALILAPTRELAQQIAEEIEALCTHKKVSHVVLVGGLPMGPQETALQHGAQIVVGTPGRVLDHHRRRNLDLSNCKIACLDEADEMVSMGFYEDVTKILDKTPEGRQVLLFSATISRDTERLVRRYLRDPEHIILSTDQDKVEGIDHIIYESPAGVHKARAMLYILDVEDPDAAIIFCNTRADTNTVASFLDRQGLDVQLLSGELPQARRSAVMKRVKAGEVRFLVATDVAARGIDISDLSHVFNYSLPQDPTVYMHRIGRTGRIGKQGRAVSLISGADMGTHKTLENVHKIAFDVLPFPEEGVAIHKRVERQARTIRAGMGHMVFESYLPTARALMERDDGAMLIATALKAFFTLDRQRKAALADVIEPDEATMQARDAQAEADAQADHESRGRGRKGKSKDRPARKERSRDEERPARSRARTEDLDALLEEGPAAPVASSSDDEGGTDEDGKKRKRRRRKKKPASTDPSPKAGGADEPLLLEDDSDMSLDIEDTLVDEPSESGDLDDLLVDDDGTPALDDLDDALISEDGAVDFDDLLSAD